MFPIITAILHDRNGNLVRQVSLTRFWYSPPKILIDGNDYYIRVSDEHTTEPAIYRRTSAVKKLDSVG